MPRSTCGTQISRHYVRNILLLVSWMKTQQSGGWKGRLSYTAARTVWVLNPCYFNSSFFIVQCKNGFEKFKWSLLTVDIYISRKEGSPEIKVASSWASGRYLMRTEDPCPKNIPRKFQFFLWGVCIFSRTALSSKLLQVIYQTQKNEKKVENMTCSRVFFNQSQVFGQ